jgi:uncharacterized short protein YbdD (DUF466 family)
MKVLHTIWKILAELAGDADYGRYCAHLRARHPGTRMPTEIEFYLARLNEKYSRPTRCC